MLSTIRVAYECLKNCPSITEDKEKLKRIFKYDDVNRLVDAVDLLIIENYTEKSADWAYCVNLSTMRSYSETYLNREEDDRDLYEVVRLLGLMVNDMNIAKKHNYYDVMKYKFKRN